MVPLSSQATESKRICCAFCRDGIVKGSGGSVGVEAGTDYTRYGSENPGNGQGTNYIKP